MDDWKKLSGELDHFDNMMYKKFDCELEDMSKKKIEAAGLLKAQLVDWVLGFAEMLCKTKKFNLDEMVKVKHLSEKVIESQEMVIILQERLLGFKEDDLETLKTSVREEMATVQNTVKSELQSLKRNCEAEHCKCTACSYVDSI